MKNKTVFKDNKIHTLNHRITHTVSIKSSITRQAKKQENVSNSNNQEKNKPTKIDPQVV